MGRPMFNKEILLNVVKDTKSRYPSWRYGQTVFNVVFILWPDVADTLRGSDVDPFHNDDLVEVFLTACESMINNLE